MRLNFHSYIQVISNFIPSEFSLDSFCDALFTSINYDKSLAFDSTYRNKMINGRRDVPSDINAALETEDGRSNLQNFLNKIFLKDYKKRPELISLKPKLRTLIESCDEDDETKSNILNILENDDLAYALSYIFIFSTHQPNKETESTITEKNLQNIFNVDKKCPLCGKPLILKENRRDIYLFESVPIFPNSTTDEFKATLNNVHPKPRTNPEITLCPKCAADYLFHPTIKSYDILWETNNRIKLEDKIEKAKYDVNLDIQLQEIISKLKTLKLTTEELQTLRLSPVDIKKKIINNPPLEHSINSDLDYFNKIKGLLSDLDSDEASFDTIASEFKTIYQKLKLKTNSQSRIYDTIIDWVLEKLSLVEDHKPAAKLVVSFFVQDCEVFDEITE